MFHHLNTFIKQFSVTCRHALYISSDSCLLCDVTIASPVFVHRGQHHLTPFPKGTIKSLYSVLLSFYFWPWMFIVSHSSFEQGNVACTGKEKFYSLAICTSIMLCTVTVTLSTCGMERPS